MIWIWLAILCLTVGWLGITPIYSPPHWTAAAFYLLAGAMFMAGLRRTNIAPLPRTYLVLLLPLACFIILIPWPYNLGALLLAAALVTIVAGERSPLLRRGAIALGGCGLVTLLEAALQPLLFRIFARSHGAPWAADIVSLILRNTGARVSVSGSIIRMQTFEELMPVNVTWEVLGFYVLTSFILAGLGLLLIFRARPSRWLAFLAISLCYPLVRYPIILLAYQESGRAILFWSPWVTLLTFLPLPLLIGRLVRAELHPPEQVRWPQLVLGRAAIKLLLVSSAASSCLIGLSSFQDPGTLKHGRLLIDEAHSNWEWTTRRYDTEWYSQASGYNYYCLADFLGYFYDVERGNEKITPKLLERYDVLILKTLTKPLQPEEIDAIEHFVRAGGGLWLIGDHTNVFGMSAHMNPLARRFGLAFKYDSTYDLNTGGLTVYRPSVLLPHPTVQHMPAVFLFGTSCSMEAGLLADYPIIGYGLRALRADYSRENFFPENKLTLDQEFGLLLQQVAVRCGRGRVVAFTDSTVLSNFWFYMPGKSELCLSTVSWLNHSNKWAFIRWLLGIAVACGLWLFIRWSHNINPRVFMVWGLAGVLLGVPIGIRAFSAVSRTVYPLPKPHRPLPRIAFEREHCNFTLPSEALDTSMALENHYHTFFVWTQRLGYMPASVPSLDGALNGAKVLVLVNPNKVFTADEVLRIKRYLQAGGRMLVLDGSHNSGSTANQLLRVFGLGVEEASFPQSFVFDKAGNRIATVERPRLVTGGEPVLRLVFGKPFLSAARVGKGLIAAMGSSHLFTDRSMGVTSVVPNAYQREIYEMEFWLFRNLLEGPPDPKQWDLPGAASHKLHPDPQAKKQRVSSRQ